MCGIAGIIGRVDDANQAALRRMAAAMAHRGPDGEGLWFSRPDAAGDGCLLAHRRLSILDLSTAASQPMTDPRGQTLVFNGEIYNYVELREELVAAGEHFQSTGDTAVMLRMLSVRGYRAVNRLRGMFAFAMWDEARRELVIARDPLGIKPLYVCRNPDTSEGRSWSLLFASEIRAILASGFLPSPRLDPDAVASVVWNGFVVGPGTAVVGIESILPGEVHVLDARGHAKVSEPFWSAPQPGQSPIGKEELRETLAESVRLHLASDVPLGVFLSGGIDSSAVANLAQKASDRPVNTFTLAFEESSYNEAHHARAVAEAIGTEHHEIVLTESGFLGSLESAFNSLDQPTFDGLNSYYISKAVRDAGLTVALVGTGGDELFGGYSSFRYVPRLHRWARRTGWVPKAMKMAGAKLVAGAAHAKGGAVAAQTRWAKLPEMVGSGDDLLRLYQLSYALFLPEFQSELLNGVAGKSRTRSGLPSPFLERLSREAAGRSPLATVSIMEQRLFLGERLLRDVDAASMAVSLETRLPLVDQVLLERVMRLPDAVRYEPLGRKQALRDAGLTELDPSLFERPKSGFVMPFDTWIRRQLRGTMDEVLRDGRLAAKVGLNGAAVARLWTAFQDGAPGLYWSRIWALYILLRWCDRHGVWMDGYNGNAGVAQIEPAQPKPASPDQPSEAPASAPAGRRYCLITPCRDEAKYARRTLDSIANQTTPPALWVIVDDASKDQTPQILAEYAAKLPYVRIVRREDRGYRKLGGGVIDAFYDGFKTINPDEYDYVCKFDLDLELPPRYFEALMERMEKDPRIGTASGKPWFRGKGGEEIDEKCGDENSVGMIKFYRVECFRQIGGFVRELMWDGIDGHRCRMRGWVAASWADPELRFEHLRPMGTSDKSWWRGRVRHGVGQWFMGTTPAYLMASATLRMLHPPLVIGGIAMMWGYFKSMASGKPQYDDPDFRRFLRRYQWRSLLQGKERATRCLHDRGVQYWSAKQAGQANPK